MRCSAAASMHLHVPEWKRLVFRSGYEEIATTLADPIEAAGSGFSVVGPGVMPGQIITDLVPGRLRSDKLVVARRAFQIAVDRTQRDVKDIRFRLEVHQDIRPALPAKNSVTGL